MWPQPRFLVTQEPFNSNTLIYKRLTVVIFDPMGFLGDGVGVRVGVRWECGGVRNLGNLWRFWVHDWPFWLERVGGGRLWERQQRADAGLIALAKRPPMFMKTTNAQTGLNIPVGPAKYLDFRQAFSLYHMTSPNSCPSRQKPQGALNCVCLGQEIPPSTLGSTQPSGEPTNRPQTWCFWCGA